MSMFPCRKCGAMVGVVGQTIYKCICPPPTQEEIAAMQAEQRKIIEDAQNGIGQIITIPSALTLQEKLQMSLACVETVKAELSAMGDVVDVDVNLAVTVNVRTSVPYASRHKKDLTPLFTVEQQLMDKFPMVDFNFEVAWDYHVEQKQPLGTVGITGVMPHQGTSKE